MKCEIHGIVMEYMGENPFGGDIWHCEHCHAEEEAEFERTTEDDDFLWFEPSEEEMDDLLDDGVYEGDVVIHQPYDDDED